MKIPLSIVIPAFNEEKRLEKSLKRILECAIIEPEEIIVVDDGSRDRTCDILLKAKEKIPNLKVLKNEKNEGKGSALKKGVLCAREDVPYLLITDADLSTPPEEIKRFFPFLNDYAILIGSRGLDRSFIKKRQPLYRERMGIIFNKMVQFLFLPGIYDTQCGFKLFKTSVAKEVFKEIKLKGFTYDVEVLILARIKGFKFKEVPVEWYHEEESKVKISKAPFLMLLELVYLYFNYRSPLKASLFSFYGERPGRKRVW